MYVMQLIHLKNIDSKIEKKIDTISQNELHIEKNYTKDKQKAEYGKKNNDTTSKVKSQLKSTEQLKETLLTETKIKEDKKNFRIQSFNDLINLANQEKEVELKYDLERNVKLVSFNKGKIDIAFNEKLNKNFIKLLTEKLLSWTGERWLISLSKNEGAKTMYEKNQEKKTSEISLAQNSEETKNLQKAFPDAKLIEVLEEDDA